MLIGNEGTALLNHQGIDFWFLDLLDWSLYWWPHRCSSVLCRCTLNWWPHRCSSVLCICTLNWWTHRCSSVLCGCFLNWWTHRCLSVLCRCTLNWWTHTQVLISVVWMLFKLMDTQVLISVVQMQMLCVISSISYSIKVSFAQCDLTISSSLLCSEDFFSGVDEVFKKTLVCRERMGAFIDLM